MEKQIESVKRENCLTSDTSNEDFEKCKGGLKTICLDNKQKIIC